MADLTGYFGEAFPSGANYIWGVLDFNSSINPGIDAAKDSLKLAGWTQNTLGSGDPDGTYATSSVIAISFPSHNPLSNGSGVPGISGGAFAGTFDGTLFQFYDPLAIPPDPDPTGPGVQGVPLTTSSLGTLNNFLADASAVTRWDWTFVSGTGLSATVAVQAKHTGTDANVDAYQGVWETNDAYLFGPTPQGGGWILYSVPAPQTGDQFKATWYEAGLPHLTLEFNPGSGQTIDYGFNQTLYNSGMSAYQHFMQTAIGAPTGMTGEQFMLASALNVPSEYGPATLTVSAISNVPGGVPVEITTSTPHGQIPQDRVNIKGLPGQPLVQGAWWVAKVVSPTKFWISNLPFNPIFGDGNAYTSGGTVTPVGGSPVNISAVTNDTDIPVAISTSTAHGFKIGDVINAAGAGGLINLSGNYTVFQVLSPSQFQIALQDSGLQVGTGLSYTGGASCVTGIFNAMVVTSQMAAFTDSGAAQTKVLAQGVFGAFPSQTRLHLDNTTTVSNTATYTFGINVPFTGVTGDMFTTAGKTMTVAPYVAVRLANGQEAHMIGSFWDAYVHTQNHDYGQAMTYDLNGFGQQNFMAWLNNGSLTIPLVTGTLWVRAGTPLTNPL